MPQLCMTVSTSCPRHGCLARDWVHAVIGQGSRHDGEIQTVHLQRALPEVDCEDVLGFTLNHAAVAHQIGNRAITMAGLTFGTEDRLVDCKCAPGETRQGVPNSANALFEGITGKEMGSSGAGNRLSRLLSVSTFDLRSPNTRRLVLSNGLDAFPKSRRQSVPDRCAVSAGAASVHETRAREPVEHRPMNRSCKTEIIARRLVRNFMAFIRCSSQLANFLAWRFPLVRCKSEADQ
jgi:hypothetical protein